MSKNKFQLYKRKTCARPTILGWVIILVFIAIIFRISLVGIYYFLTVNRPVETKTLVIEGWVPSYALKDAVSYFNENNYDRLIVTGLPIANYEFISSFKTTAQATVEALKHYGYYDTVYVATIPTNILVDRTYNTAVATKMLFEENTDWSQNFNIYSVGVHSRRSRMMFEKVFGSNFDIGIIAHRDRTFAPNYWWKSSKGFRNVSNEFAATMYVMLFFHPEIELFEDNILTGRYIDSIYFNREDKYIEFADSITSPFNKVELSKFHGFNYFDPNIDFRVNAKFTVDTSGTTFGMKTTTARTPTYRIFGYLNFVVNDTVCKLVAFQNMDYINHPDYGGHLFVPFTDLSNANDTYAAGRYIDIVIPNSQTVILDFNEAYNPYCAYSERWSCPLVPYENHVNVHVRAGEKKYK
ncbi:MAG: DUF1684 domain-containing protein [Bacteroidota bacterium]